jgi:hypothetical protein
MLLAILISRGFTVFAGNNNGIPDNITLVKNKKPLFRIIVADRPGKKYEPEKWHSNPPSCWLYFAAADLASYIEKSTGAKPEVLINKTKDDGLINIHLGMTDYVKGLKLDLPKPHGFVIRFPDKKNIVIAGMPLDSQGFNTLYGVSYFLQTYLGIKWLYPGELGEDIPRMDTLVIPTENVRIVPDFPFRGVASYLKSFSERKKSWAALYYGMRMGLTTSLVLEFGHNTGNIIDPDKYSKTHPEFFPLRNGKRYFPPRNPKNPKWKTGGWEPCYCADGIVDEAAKNIIEYFDKHPGRYTYSLGINDGGGAICQCEKCTEKNKEFPSWCISQSYYEWVNEVVKKVRKKYPDRYFGLLAYGKIPFPPKNIKLDDHIVPVIALDLKYYADPGLAKRINRDYVDYWYQSGATLGWWDYSFSGAYLVPAFYAHHLADTLKYLYKHNLRFYFDELHPGKYWRNAPQIYMVNKLLWNINLNADDLLTEWYEAAVGKKAAPYLAKYFAVWEKFWTKEVIKTYWFQKRFNDENIAPFLQRRDADYLEALNRKDLLACHELLQKVVQLAETEKQKKRAEFIYNYFVMADSKYYQPYLNGMDAKKAANKKYKILHEYKFDKGLDGWVRWQMPYHTAKLGHTENEGRSSRGCLTARLGNSLPTDLVFYKRPIDLKLEAGKTYKISVWSKVDKASSGEFVRLVIFFPKTDGKVLGNIPGSKGSFSIIDRIDKNGRSGIWEELSVYFSVPAEAWTDVKGVDCQIEVLGPRPESTFWFDDFSIAEVQSDEIIPPVVRKQAVSERKAEKNSLGPELVTDGDMEAAGTDNWPEKYNPKVREKSSEYKHSGKQSLHIVSDSGGDGVVQIFKPAQEYDGLFLKSPDKMFKKGKTYRVSLWVKNADPKGFEQIAIIGTDLNEKLNTKDSEWTEFVFKTTYTGYHGNPFFAIAYGSKKADVYIDDVSIREIIKKEK